MNKGLKIIIHSKLPDDFLKNTVQKNAKKLELEGFSQPMNKKDIKVVIFGNKENVDSFVDILQEEFIKIDMTDFEIEPHIKDRDYRGVFRIIE